MSTKLQHAGRLAVFVAVALTCVGPCFADDEAPSPGPALEARQKLFERIQQAKSQGIGIAGYLQAYKALDEQVKAGDSADKINTRVEQINKAVNDQLDRAKILKSQKPLPPQGSQVNGSSTPVASPTPRPAGSPAAAGGPPTTASGSAGGGKGDSLSKLNIPDSIKDRLLSDPSLLQKLKDKLGR
jgi:hypothetical protein